MKTTLKFILWALPKGQTDRLHEKPLTSFPISAVQVETVKQHAKKDGWHSFRAVRENGNVPDFGKTLNL